MNYKMFLCPIVGETLYAYELKVGLLRQRIVLQKVVRSLFQSDLQRTLSPQLAAVAIGSASSHNVQVLTLGKTSFIISIG